MEQIKREDKVTVIDLWTYLDGQKKKAHITTHHGRIFCIEIEDPRVGTVTLGLIALLKLTRAINEIGMVSACRYKKWDRMLALEFPSGFCEESKPYTVCKLPDCPMYCEKYEPFIIELMRKPWWKFW